MDANTYGNFEPCGSDCNCAHLLAKLQSEVGCDEDAAMRLMMGLYLGTEIMNLVLATTASRTPSRSFGGITIEERVVNDKQPILNDDPPAASAPSAHDPVVEADLDEKARRRAFMT